MIRFPWLLPAESYDLVWAQEPQTFSGFRHCAMGSALSMLNKSCSLALGNSTLRVEAMGLAPSQKGHCKTAREIQTGKENGQKVYRQEGSPTCVLHSVVLG